jgi:NAD kinase
MIQSFPFSIDGKTTLEIFVGMNPLFLNEQNAPKLEQVFALADCNSNIKFGFHFDKGYESNSFLQKFLASKTHLSIKFASEFEPDTIDLVFTFGGDGSVLWSNKAIQNQPKAVYLSFNTGHLGYLSFMDINALDEIFHKLNAHFCNPAIPTDIHYSSYKKIKCQVKDDKGHIIKTLSAINEIATNRTQNYSIIYKIYWNGIFMTSINADGLIFCSSLGSTAYNSSVQGPILLQNNCNIILSAIAPFGINLRSIVFGEHDTLRVEISDRAYGDVCQVMSDSNTNVEFRKGQYLEISIDQESKINLASFNPNFDEQWVHKIAKMFKWN